MNVAICNISTAPAHMRQQIQRKAGDHNTFNDNSLTGDLGGNIVSTSRNTPFPGNTPCFMPTQLFNSLGIPTLVVLERNTRGRVEGAALGVAKSIVVTSGVEHVQDHGECRDATLFVPQTILQHLGCSSGDVCTLHPAKEAAAADAITFGVRQPVGCNGDYNYAVIRSASSSSLFINRPTSLFPFSGSFKSPSKPLEEPRPREPAF